MSPTIAEQGIDSALNRILRTPLIEQIEGTPPPEQLAVSPQLIPAPRWRRLAERRSSAKVAPQEVPPEKQPEEVPAQLRLFRHPRIVSVGRQGQTQPLRTRGGFPAGVSNLPEINIIPSEQGASERVTPTYEVKPIPSDKVYVIEKGRRQYGKFPKIMMTPYQKPESPESRVIKGIGGGIAKFQEEMTMPLPWVGLSPSELAGVALLGYAGYEGVKSLIPLTKELGDKALQIALNTGLDKWITKRSVGIPSQYKAQDVLYKSIVKNKLWLQERARENMLRRMGRGGEATQAVREVVDDTIRDLETQLLPTFTPGGTAVPGQTRPLADIMAGAKAELVPKAPLTKALWDATPVAQRVINAQAAGLSGQVSSKAFEALTSAERTALEKITAPVTPAPEVREPEAGQWKLVEKTGDKPTFLIYRGDMSAPQGLLSVENRYDAENALKILNTGDKREARRVYSHFGRPLAEDERWLKNQARLPEETKPKERMLWKVKPPLPENVIPMTEEEVTQFLESQKARQETPAVARPEAVTPKVTKAELSDKQFAEAMAQVAKREKEYETLTKRHFAEREAIRDKPRAERLALAAKQQEEIEVFRAETAKEPVTPEVTKDKVFGWNHGEVIKKGNEFVIQHEDTKEIVKTVSSEREARAFFDGYGKGWTEKGSYTLSIKKAQYLLVKDEIGRILLRTNKSTPEIAQSFIEGYKLGGKREVDFWRSPAERARRQLKPVIPTAEAVKYPPTEEIAETNPLAMTSTEFNARYPRLRELPVVQQQGLLDMLNETNLEETGVDETLDLATFVQDMGDMRFDLETGGVFTEEHQQMIEAAAKRGDEIAPKVRMEYQDIISKIEQKKATARVLAEKKRQARAKPTPAPQAQKVTAGKAGVAPVAAGSGAPPKSPLSRVQAMWDRGKLPPKPSKDPTKPTFMENWNDAYYELRKMQTRVAKGETLTPGGKDDLITLLTRAPGAVNAGVARAKLLLNEIKKVARNISSDDINTFVYIRHAQEVLKAKGIARVMAGGFKDPAELQQALDDLANRLGSEKFEQVHKAAEILIQAYDRELTRMVDSGLVSEALATELKQKYPWYNPLQYLDDLEELEAQGKSVKPFNVVTSGLKRLTEKGTAKDAVAPLNILGEQLIRNEVRIVKNDTSAAIIDLALKDKTLAGIKKISGVKPVAQVQGEILFRRTWEDLPGTISFFKDGKRQIYKVPDFIYREANIISRITANPVSSIVGSINGVTRSAFTSASIPFTVSNVFNDMLVAYINRGIMPTQTATRLMASLRGLQNDKVMQSFRLAGGLQARFYGESGEQIAKDAALASKVTRGGNPFIIRAIRSATKPIEAMGQAGEQSPRMALFKRQLDKTLSGWRNMTAEEIAATPQGRKAAAESVELTINFARGGYLIKAANPFIIFLNASFEGTKLPYRALRDNPAARWRLAAFLVGLAGLTAYNLTKKEYMDVPDYLRWGSILIMLPPTEKNPDGTDKPNYLVVVPRTREWAMFSGSLTYGMERMFAEEPAALGQFAATLFPSVSPINDIPLMPILQEPVEQIANYDFFTGRKMVSESLENLPATEQTTPSVSRTVEELSQKAGVSPIRVQHALNGLFGGAFQAPASVSDYILELVSPREVKPEIKKLAEQYQSLPVEKKTRDTIAQEDFLRRLTASNKREMLNYINRKEAGLPLISTITRRFYPQRGGQLESNRYELEQRVKDIPAYFREQMTPDQMRTADIALWEDRKNEGAKLIERYSLSNLGKTDAQREIFLSENSDVDVAKLLWDGNTTTIHSVDAAKLLEEKANEFGIPLNLVPAFSLTDKGKERIPSDQTLWKPYFDYYALPGNGGYLSYSKEKVDAGKLPAKYLAEWEAYQKLKTDTAKTLYREYHREATKNRREAFRRANPEIDKWLQENEGLKPLSKVSLGGASSKLKIYKRPRIQSRMK